MGYNVWLVYSFSKLGNLGDVEDDSGTDFSFFVYLGNLMTC